MALDLNCMRTMAMYRPIVYGQYVDGDGFWYSVMDAEVTAGLAYWVWLLLLLGRV